MNSSSLPRGVRLLAAGTVVNALGNGLYLPLSLVLLGTLSELSLTTVGVVLTGAMIASLALMPFGGVLVDRRGPKRVLIWALVAQAVAFVGYPLAHGVPAFALLALSATTGGQAVKAAQPVLVAMLTKGPERARLLALTRSLANAGLGLGGLALVCLPMDAGRGWWVAASWANAASFVVAAFIYACQAPHSDGGEPDRLPVSQVFNGTVWRNRQFRVYLLANTYSSIGYAALSNLVPLLAIMALDLPPALAGGLFTLNTIVTAVAGVPAVRLLQRFGIADLTAAVVGMLAMAGGMASFPVATVIPSQGWRAVVLIVGMTVYSLGEAVHSPTSTSLALEASPVGQRGTYQCGPGIGAWLKRAPGMRCWQS